MSLSPLYELLLDKYIYIQLGYIAVVLYNDQSIVQITKLLHA